jgi:hypothetical protein
MYIKMEMVGELNRDIEGGGDHNNENEEISDDEGRAEEQGKNEVAGEGDDTK